MISNLKHIDSAFRHVKFWTLILVSASILGGLLTAFISFQAMKEAKEEVYLIAQDQVIRAFVSDREAALGVESKSHIRRLHELLFTLSPDEDLISAQWNEALYLGDESIKFHLDNLKETGYTKQLLGANVSQRLLIDSISVNEHEDGFPFQFYGRLEIIRASVIQYRLLISSGHLRLIQRTSSNPHGLLIEGWEIVDNRDLYQRNR